MEIDYMKSLLDIIEYLCIAFMLAIVFSENLQKILTHLIGFIPPIILMYFFVGSILTITLARVFNTFLTYLILKKGK